MPSLERVTYFFFHSLLSEFPLRFSKMPWRKSHPRVKFNWKNLRFSLSLSQQHEGGQKHSILPSSGVLRSIWNTRPHRCTRPHGLHTLAWAAWCQVLCRRSGATSGLWTSACPTCLMGMERPLPRSALKSALLLFESLPLRPCTDKHECVSLRYGPAACFSTEDVFRKEERARAALCRLCSLSGGLDHSDWWWARRNKPPPVASPTSEEGPD